MRKKRRLILELNNGIVLELHMLWTKMKSLNEILKSHRISILPMNKNLFLKKSHFQISNNLLKSRSLFKKLDILHLQILQLVELHKILKKKI